MPKGSPSAKYRRATQPSFRRVPTRRPRNTRSRGIQKPLPVCPRCLLNDRLGGRPMEPQAGPMISSDSHIVEPPDLWETWLTSEFRPRAPKLVQDEEGGDAWLYNDGGAPAPLGLVTVTRGRPREELRWSGAHYSTINQGNFRGEARVEEMREDGVVAEVI